MMTNEKKHKTLDISSFIERIYALLLIAIGTCFIVIPNTITNILPIMLLIVLILHIGFLVYKSLSADNRIVKIASYVIIAISIVIGVLLLVFGKNHLSMISILMTIHIFLQIAESIYRIIRNKKEKRKVLVEIFKIVIFSTLIAGLLIEPYSNVQTHVIIYGTLFMIQGIVNILSSFKIDENGTKISHVLAKSHTVEILSGLFIVIVIASILLPLCEPSIKNFGDGLWYSFMLITTIGFGDMTAVTPAGRLISVVVGIYGIIVIALVTSILVNLYNEHRDKIIIKQKVEDETDKED